MSDVSSSETHTVVDYISSIILNASDSYQGNTLMIENERHQEKMIRDIIQTAIAVISPGGALDIRECIDDIVWELHFFLNINILLDAKKWRTACSNNVCGV